MQCCTAAPETAISIIPTFSRSSKPRRPCAPLYLHPQSPPSGVRTAYYEGFDAALDTLFAIAGIGWHYETGMQVLRLILSGSFDKLPDLQLIIGHWGEVVLFYLDRIDILTGPGGCLGRSPIISGPMSP